MTNHTMWLTILAVCVVLILVLGFHQNSRHQPS
jgi:hypothetical protein